MRPKNPVASTAAKITTAMIFFMTLFRKALKPDVRGPQTYLAQTNHEASRLFATFRQERHHFEKLVAVAVAILPERRMASTARLCIVPVSSESAIFRIADHSGRRRKVAAAG